MDSKFNISHSSNSQRFQLGKRMLLLSVWFGLTSPTKNRRASTHTKSTEAAAVFNRPQFPLSNLRSSQGTAPGPPFLQLRSQESQLTGPKQLTQSKIALDLLHIREVATHCAIHTCLRKLEKKLRIFCMGVIWKAILYSFCFLPTNTLWLVLGIKYIRLIA